MLHLKLCQALDVKLMSENFPFLLEKKLYNKGYLNQNFDIRFTYIEYSYTKGNYKKVT